MLMLFERIFSIKTKRTKGRFTKKILTILGIKISWTKPQVQDILDITNIQYSKINNNLIYFVFRELENAKDDELFCLSNTAVCFIFNKNIIQFGYNNFLEFVLNNLGSTILLLAFKKLPEKSSLYKEHIARTDNNEFLWKYIDRNNLISHSYILFENSQFYICEKILDKAFIKVSGDKYRFTAKNTKRLFVPGMSLRLYIQNKSFDEKKEAIIRLIEYIYSKFSVDNNKVDGIVLDCHLGNFIIDDNLNFHFIDDDYVADKPLDKKHVVTYVMNEIEDYYLCKDIFEHFGYFNLPELETKKRYELCNKYIEIKNRYFT